MAEAKRRRPQKAFTRKDFRYKREWKTAKENEQQPKEKSLGDIIGLIYAVVTTFSVLASFTHGVKTGIGTCFILLIGLIMNAIGVIFFERKSGLLYISGFLLIISSFAVMLYEAYFWR